MQAPGPICGKGLLLVLAPLQVHQMAQLQEKGTISQSRDTSPGGQNQMHHNFRPLLREKMSKGKDGFVVPDFTATEVRAAVTLTPILWFHQAAEHMHLCIYQHKNLTILLLIPASSLVNGEEGIAHVKKHLLENVSDLYVIYHPFLNLLIHSEVKCSVQCKEGVHVLR
jgi:hypothetical protein